MGPGWVSGIPVGKPVGQVPAPDPFIRRHDPRIFDGIGQFPNISRVIIGVEQLLGLGGNALELGTAAAQGIAPLEKLGAQQGDVLPPLPQGRQVDFHRIEAVEQIPPEGAGFHHGP